MIKTKTTMQMAEDNKPIHSKLCSHNNMERRYCDVLGSEEDYCLDCRMFIWYKGGTQND